MYLRAKHFRIYTSAAISFPFSITQVVHLFAIHPFHLLSSFSSTLRLRAFDCRVYVRPFCPTLDIAVIKIGCHYSLTQFFFNLSRPYHAMRHTCLPIYLRIHTNFRNHFAHDEFRRLVQFLRRVFAVRFSRFRLRSLPHPVADTFLGKGVPRHSSEANFNLFGYASHPLCLPSMMREERFLTTMIARLMKRSVCA